MKAGWKLEKLGDVCDIIMGQSPDGKSYNSVGQGIPLINGPVEFSNGSFGETVRSKFTTQPTKLCKEGDLILCVRGSTTGRMNIAGFDACIGRGVAAIRAKQFQPWINYFVSSKRDEIHGKGTGATFPNVSGTMLANFELLMPPLPEQQRIVAILDEAFEAIAAARTNTEQNRQNARALFESYLQSAFSQRGEGWIEATIGEICTLKSGTSVNVSLEKPTGDLAYVKVSDMSYAGNETAIYSSSRFLNMCDVGKNAIFPVGTTIFPKRGGAILTNKKRLAAVPICADLNIMGVIPPDSLSAQLLYYYFLNVDMKRLGSGSSIPQINNYDIAPLMLSFPENKEQQYKLVQNIDALHKATQRLESLYQSKITALDELKRSLLQQAFSGQL
ncbi:restriction endonuclease subunit S [Aeromonas veronii]|uniref:restriction endonuclease subunit S n=1 Tax=Aeromonas veronii TaxID=654 RepID=UPI003EC6D8FC